MLTFGKYVAVFTINIRQAFALPVRTAANAIISGVRLFFLFVIYTYTYTYVEGDLLMPLASTLAALAVYNILLAMNLRRVFDTITKDIKTGMFEVSYLRPMNYFLAAAVERFGHTFMLMLATLAVATVLFAVFSPGLPPTLGPAMLLWGAMCALLDVVLSGFLYTLVALPALWINDAEPFYYILDKTILILGGAYVPVALFPGWIQAIAVFSPFGAVMAGTRMFDANFLSAAPLYVLMQVVWIVILWVAVVVAMRVAARHIAINGG